MQPQKRVFIKTYGCQMNVYDSEKMVYLLEKDDYQLASDMKEADVILLNTCSIREKPEHKIYSILGRLKALKDKNPNLILGVGGCVAQQEGERLLEQSPHLDLVFGTQRIGDLPYLLKAVQENKTMVCDVEMTDAVCAEAGVLPVHPKHVSSYVSIIRGCNNFCSFCVVPYVRGREQSRPLNDIVAEVTHLAQRGVKEIVLLGQNVHSYGNDCGITKGFPGLLAALNDVSGLERIRFITSHPKDLSIELIQCFSKLDKLCEHIHLPVQSGSNSILKRMNRKYTREDYLEKVNALRTVCPQIGITSDVIVGFPGETSDDYQETLSLMEEVRFDDLFSFQYSDRPNTAANRFGDKVPPDIKGERLIKLQAMQEEHSLERNRALVGSLEEILVEGVSKKDSQRMTGKTRSHKTVNFRGGEELRGRLVSVRIKSANVHALYGERE
ncbi:MAG: tRNA (N6-isopentenyl adenosine(37)-C2)-methylthiotransferase MiaB [Thermodesulfobacteriota bacterium]|nr:tRNA (N6-isopentenyl adenosine(37)-C2)-methylthiotransferase MiaB [Thermodesulfobacteriota bacterium]